LFNLHTPPDRGKQPTRTDKSGKETEPREAVIGTVQNKREKSKRSARAMGVNLKKPGTSNIQRTRMLWVSMQALPNLLEDAGPEITYVYPHIHTLPECWQIAVAVAVEMPGPAECAPYPQFWILETCPPSAHESVMLRQDLVGNLI
jgi:hypothetical protein